MRQVPFGARSFPQYSDRGTGALGATRPFPAPPIKRSARSVSIPVFYPYVLSGSSEPEKLV